MKLEPREMADAAIAAVYGYPSGVAGVVIGMVIVAYLCSTTLIQYVYGCIITTLAIVEEPVPTALLRTSAHEEPDAPLPPYSDKAEDVKEPLIQQEVLLIKNKPITTSCGGTIRHLRSRGASAYRGAGILILYCFLNQFVVSILSMFFFPMGIVGYGLALVFSQVALTRVSMLWTHMVISEPSEKWWYQRFVPYKTARKAYLPTLAVALSQVGAFVVPGVVMHVLGLERDMRNPPKQMTDEVRVIVAAKALAVCGIFFGYILFVVVPLFIALTRVYAALLPEHETTIVQMDRSFGGRFISEADGGRGKLSLRDAWKTFDWNGRVRLVKIWVKMIAISMAISVGSLMVIVATAIFAQ